MEPGPVIVWFRRDLRVADNPALLRAAESGGPVIPVYVAGWEDGQAWAPGRAGRWWLDRSLEKLSTSLAGRGAPLRIVRGAAREEIPRLARDTGASLVVWNRLYERHVGEIDQQVSAGLEANRVPVQAFEGSLLFEPDGHFSRAGRTFTQFTAFWRSCRSLPDPPLPRPGPAVLRSFGNPQEPPGPTRPARSARPAGESRGGWRPQTVDTEAWEPGEGGALRRLNRFLEGGLEEYASRRDFPGIDGTSRLSPHLHFGEVGPRQIWHAVRAAAAQTQAAGGRPEGGAEAFLRQLGWREFGHYLLFHFPHIAEEPFRPEFARFPWADDPEGLEAWQQGETGYPLVDAAMRQLLAEGWIHNRARMVAASFLTKDLLIPWQRGAAWFWDHLVDADLANNSLGWQWTAGSGPDAAPYFRVFNPVLQARRFDQEGAYADRWSPVPRTASPGAAPTGARGAMTDAGRPLTPIVDHDEARARALAAFRGVRRA